MVSVPPAAVPSIRGTGLAPRTRLGGNCHAGGPRRGGSPGSRGMVANGRGSRRGPRAAGRPGVPSVLGGAVPEARGVDAERSLHRVVAGARPVAAGAERRDDFFTTERRSV